MKIEGKVALVTGGGTGVGRATALALARGGCSVVINYSKSKEEAEATAHEVEASGVRALVVQANVGDDAACRRLVDAAVGELGRLDILVNNAGTTEFIQHQDLDAVTDEAWERIFSINLRGPFYCVRAASRALKASGNGAVVNVSSVAGLVGVGSSIPYCASKAALNNLTLTLARALAPEVRVNAVCPGFITGRWLKGGLGDAYDFAVQHYSDKSLLKKVCDPEDVAAAILSFVSGSDLITGQILTVDGGMILGAG